MINTLVNPGMTTPQTQSERPSRRRPMDAIFTPRNVAVIGATETENAVGRTILWNLIASPFGGTVFPVNPKRASVLGIKAYPSIAEVPAKIDLAVIVTPAAAVPGLVAQCSAVGVRGVIVISAGFKELGKEGVKLEEQIMVEDRKTDMRIIGPNCLGVMNPIHGLNATFAKGMGRKGNVAFLSQSGALATAILDWGLREEVGFSAFVSVGSMVDVGWGDLIDYLGDDPNTKSILIYMESIGDARAFLSAAREVALNKPIIVLKAGRTEAASRAAASHTGALAGSDDALVAAFRRAGVLRVDRIADLFYMAEVLAKQPRPAGPRLTMVTNAGGPGVLATDALITGGGKLTAISTETFNKLNAFLPPHWSRNNPIDILGDAGGDRYAKALEIAAADPNSDGLLVILTPQDMTKSTETAEELKKYASSTGKPVLASFMGGEEVEAGKAILNHAGIPTFDYPDTAAAAFNYMWRYSYNLKGLYETPSAAEQEVPDRDSAGRIITAARSAGRTLLTEAEAKQLLSAYLIPVTQTIAARTRPEAAEAAQKMGYPVAVKLLSNTITHKTDVGGVHLDVRDADGVQKAYEAIRKSVSEKVGEEHFQGVTVQPMISLNGYELIIGCSTDEQFGPVLLFGSGGQLVEVMKDRALALPPLNATLARRMMESTKIYTALQGVRGRKAVNMAALEQVMVRFSQLVVEQKWIKEIEINPLLASAEQLIAVDARVVLHDPSTREADLPRTAIRPYPIQYVTNKALKDGAEVTVRPIRPEDEPAVAAFHQTLSERSVSMRYFHHLQLGQRVAHERLVRVCFADYDRELPLVAEHLDEASGKREIVGIGRLSRQRGGNSAEVAIVISDAWQGKGLGTLLMKMLVEVARKEGVQRLSADILSENFEMQRLMEKAGFKLVKPVDDNVIKAEMALVGNA